MLTPFLIVAVAGYLLGSLPFGYLVARSKGVNIFEVGSKNPGATNVRRVLGHGPGNLVLFLDAAKGAAAAGWSWLWSLRDETSVAFREHLEWLMIAGVLAAIIGHSFSCFTGFKGGKSVATAAGGFLVVFPVGMVISIAIFGGTLALTRFVSLSSMLGAISLPISALIVGRSLVLVIITALVALFVVVRHRANISRLLAGTESKVGQKKAAGAGAPPATPASKS